MKLTPIDIRKQEFKKVLRGYDPVEVDTFMEMLAGEFETLVREHKQYRDSVTELEQQLRDYRQIEKALQQTLLQAQEATAKAFEAARREADLLVRDAETKAAGLMEQAATDRARLHEEILQLQGRREEVVGKLRMLLSTEMDLLSAYGGGGEEQPPASGEPPAAGARDSVALDDILRDLDDDPLAHTR
jgi:cell division initiation protein